MLDAIIAGAIRHRWLVLFGTALVSIGGLFAVRELPIDAFPDVTNVQVEVVCTAPGKSPLEIEGFVTTPVENSLRGVPGMTGLRSVSKYGISVITVVFKDGTDIYFARQQVSERLGEIRERFGKGVEVTIGPIATAMGEIYQYTLDAPGLEASADSLAELRTLQDWVIAPLLKGVDGVNEVHSFGGYIKEYQVVALPDRIAQYGVDLKSLYEAVARNNSNVGGGILEAGGEQHLIRGIGRIRGTEDIERIVVATRKGSPILVKDVAQVRIGHAVRQGASFQDGKREVVGGVVMMLRGADSRRVVREVERKVREINGSGVLPAGTAVRPFYTRDTVITESIRTISKALGEGSLVVVAAVYLFLLSLRGSLVIILALPLAALMTAILMRPLGLTGNLMSLGGLAISIGMIIDSTIIQVENALHHLPREESLPARISAVTKAILEVRKPSIFGELIIALTFLPILALEGIEGKMFQPLALTIMLALFSSLLLSILVIPTLCVLILRPAQDDESPIVTWAKRAYLPLLRWGLAHKAAVLTGSGVLLAGSLCLVPFLGTEFVPIMDEGSFDMDTSIAPGASLETSAGVARTIEERLMTFPELETVVSRTGWTGRAIEARGVEKTGFLGVLKPKREWVTARTREELFEKMRAAVKIIPGVVVGFSQPIQCRVDELVAGARSQLAIRLYGDDLALLGRKGQEIVRSLSGIRGVTDLAMERQEGQSYINVDVKRDSISRYGLNVSDLHDVMEIALGGKPAGSVYEGDRAFDVAIRLPEAERASIAALNRLIIAAPAEGPRLPLSMLADIRREDGPVQIGRESGKRRILIEANVLGRDLGGFVAEAQRRIRKEVALPTGYYLTWGGQFENQQRAMRKLAVIVPGAILLIFVLLAVTLDSIRQALLVLLNLPLSLVGGVLALFLSGTYLSVPAAVGFIALFGVAVLNGVVLVTTINQLRARPEMDTEKAVLVGCERRMRPVLMTAAITVCSLVPMLFASGPGSEVQRPLAIVVIGGLTTSTLLTLMVLPALYGALSEGPRPRA
ncbi:MAG TPA: CusA/CzcA family heavy metal efflux RND transporter [Elusimicrobia bacterium]|nr:CusA/CzcA family heavy metal efflux RND transporter [Elusimicrobiota bacterium]